MKYSNIFKEKLNCNNTDEVFEYLIANLKDTITRWNYFVNWNKVFGNIRDIEVDLNTLNYLIGKDNIESEFAYLLRRTPSIYALIPILVACRQNNFKILFNYTEGDFVYRDYSFKYSPKKERQLPEEKISAAIEFTKKIGFLDLLKSKRIKNCVDYVIGVETGLDSNGRKNRGGKMMEDILEFFIKDICDRNGFEYMIQATAPKVKQKWNLKMTIDKSSRQIDFAIFAGNTLFLIETNFYGGGGSKLKSTAGEYITMSNYWKNDGHKFIWITDGKGWHSTKRPLEETFNQIDFLLNLDMVSKGILDDLIKKES